MNAQEIAALICARLGEALTALATALGGAVVATTTTGKTTTAATTPAGDAKVEAQRAKVREAAAQASARLKAKGQDGDAARAAVKSAIATAGGTEVIADVPVGKLKAVFQTLEALDYTPPADDSTDEGGW